MTHTKCFTRRYNKKNKREHNNFLFHRTRKVEDDRRLYSFVFESLQYRFCIIISSICSRCN